MSPIALKGWIDLKFECPSCSSQVDDEIDNVCYNWDAESPGMADGYVSCPSCHAHYHLVLTAYPFAKRIVVLEYPETAVEFHDDSFEDLGLDSEPSKPIDAFQVYERSRNEVSELESSIPLASGPRSSLLRMLFLQSVVMLEAYLSDRIIKLVLTDDTKLRAVVGCIEVLRDRNCRFIDVVKTEDFVRTTVKNHLRDFSFHNIGSVAKIYRSALHVDIVFDDNQRKDIQEIVVKRHHIVHRNGLDNDGVPVAIGIEDVRHAREVVDDIVRRIEHAFVEYEYSVGRLPL